jgi:hypothetical protein
MRARIGIGLGAYWSGIAYAMDVIAAITALGATGGLPAVLNALTQYTRFATSGLRGLKSRAATTPAQHALCNKG